MRFPTTDRTGRLQFAALLLLCSAATTIVVLAVWRPWGVKAPDPAKPCDETARQKDCEKALDLQRSGKWCEAKTAWEQLLKEIPEGDACGSLKAEAEFDKQIAEKHCKAESEGIKSLQLPEEAQQRRQSPPSKVPEDQLLAAYPVGRKVHSIGIANITGQGQNTAWLLRGTKNFAYQYRVVVETKVMENNGSRLGCEIQFKDVHQIRAVSTRTLTLIAPASPLLKLIWDQIDSELRALPPYLVVRKVHDLLDPELEKLLTLVANTFFPPEKDDEIVALFDQFSGLRVQAEYISGLGITKLEVLDGKKFARDDLENLAYSLSLMMDYFVGTVADAKVGEEKTLRVEDLVGMLVTGYDVSPRGTIGFAKVKEGQSKGRDEVELEIRGGEILVQGKVGGRNQTGSLRPMSGQIQYLPAQHLVSRATVNWEAAMDWVPESNLLFGTTGFLNLKMFTYYEAERVDQPKPAAKSER
jgi:hypothetical protein